MDFVIRKAIKEDMDRVYELIHELAVFEKEPDAVEITVNDLKQAGFESPKQMTCFVAEYEGKVEGIALVYDRFSTWKGRVIHLEDLIVSTKMRGKGLGTKLLDAVVKYAHEEGVKRVSWEVLDWNEPAIAFYESKGANVMRDWHVVQLDQKGMESYISKL